MKTAMQLVGVVIVLNISLNSYAGHMRCDGTKFVFQEGGLNCGSCDDSANFYNLGTCVNRGTSSCTERHYNTGEMIVWEAVPASDEERLLCESLVALYCELPCELCNFAPNGWVAKFCEKGCSIIAGISCDCLNQNCNVDYCDDVRHIPVERDGCWGDV